VGRVTRWLARDAATVRALDVSPAMLEQAQALNPELTNVTWLLGDGESLAPIEDGSADLCFSDVVFQHIPDTGVQLGYVREIGRVLRPGGWAALQISNVPAIHARRGPRERLRTRLAAALGRGPSGQEDPAWLGAAIDLDDLRRVAGEAGMRLQRVAGEGSQHCHVLLRRDGG
jgi:SAM-dependent methyltransferase